MQLLLMQFSSIKIKCNKEESGMKDFLKYLRPYKRDAALAVLCIELETVFELIIPLVMASIVDVGVASGDRHYILMKGLQMVFLP